MKTPPEPRRDLRERRSRCANEGCPREAEPGELLCDPCGLEQSLFRRDLRAAGNRPPAAPR